MVSLPSRADRQILTAKRAVVAPQNNDRRPGDLVGQIFTLIVLTVAAAEAAIGLAIVVVYFRNRGTIDVADIDNLKG